TGSFSGTEMGIGGAGSIQSVGDSEDIFVLALDSATGAPVPGFGSGGVQTFGGSNSDRLNGTGCLAVSGSAVYVTGEFYSTDAGIGGMGKIHPVEGPYTFYGDTFVLALDATTGAGVQQFGSSGVQTFGGWYYDYGSGIAVHDTTVY